MTTKEDIEHLLPNAESSEFIRVNIRDIPDEQKFENNKQHYDLGLEITFVWGEVRLFRCFETVGQSYEEKVDGIYYFLSKKPTLMRLKDDKDHEVLVDLDKAAIFKLISFVNRATPDARYS